MIRVRVTPEFIQSCVVQGKSYPKTTIEDGLPDGVELVDVKYEGGGRHVDFYFVTEDDFGPEITDKLISFNVER